MIKSTLAIVAAATALSLIPAASTTSAAQAACYRVCTSVPVATFCRTPFGVRIACGVRLQRVCSIPRVCY